MYVKLVMGGKAFGRARKSSSRRALAKCPEDPPVSTFRYPHDWGGQNRTSLSRKERIIYDVGGKTLQVTGWSG